MFFLIQNFLEIIKEKNILEFSLGHAEKKECSLPQCLLFVVGRDKTDLLLFYNYLFKSQLA